jgi:hypothetical protein
MNNHSYRVNSTGPHDPRTLAEEEARLIREASGKNPLRLHTVGDAPSEEAAKILSEACEEYTAKMDKPVWTYTHADVPRKAWGSVSVLKSVHTIDGAKRARAEGYAPALVTAFDSPRKWVDGGIEWIPCPNQTTGGKITCDTCRLCWNADKLHEKGKGIAFHPHGNLNAEKLSLLDLARG